MEHERDYIEITTNDGNRIKAELVSKFDLENVCSYVIYKIDNEYYGAKYLVNGEETILVTDLTEEEKALVNSYAAELGV